MGNRLVFNLRRPIVVQFVPGGVPECLPSFVSIARALECLLGCSSTKWPIVIRSILGDEPESLSGFFSIAREPESLLGFSFTSLHLAVYSFLS